MYKVKIYKPNKDGSLCKDPEVIPVERVVNLYWGNFAGGDFSDSIAVDLTPEQKKGNTAKRARRFTIRCKHCGDVYIAKTKLKKFCVKPEKPRTEQCFYLFEKKNKRKPTFKINCLQCKKEIEVNSTQRKFCNDPCTSTTFFVLTRERLKRWRG
tara:strand:+ start:499 stop:960 length:462 start_codon:yes stop_codon:yes gene_type:complete